MTTRQQTPKPLPAAVMDRAVATRLASVLLAVVRKDAGDGSGMTVPPVVSPPAPMGQSASPPASPPAMIPVTVTVMVPSGMPPVSPPAAPSLAPPVASAPVPDPGPLPGQVPSPPTPDQGERPAGADAFDRLVADHARANPGGPMPAWVMQSGVAHQDIWNKARAEAAMSPGRESPWRR